jgi:hypothetical protein
MKHVQTLVFAAICGFVLTLAAGAAAQSIQPGVATVVRIVGEARYSLGDGIWHPLVAGKILAAGSVIQAGHDARVDIILGKKILMPQADPLPDRVSLAADSDVRGFVSYKPSAEQNAVRMMGDTVLAIDKLTVSDTGVDSVSDTELDLRQGRIYCSVKKISGASQYLVKLPNGIAGVRGSLVIFDASGYCAALHHSIVLSIIVDGRPITVLVGEGNEYDPRSGLVRKIPPSLTTELDQIFDVLRTLYYGEVDFTFDRTQCHISPTQGHHGGSHGGWWGW